jgi:SanA protein
MKYLRNTSIVLLFLLIFLFFSNFTITNNAKLFTYTNIIELPKKQVALVLGARVYSNGRMSSILSDRVKTALELYRGGKVSKILLSGDHGTKDYDEVNAMKNYLLINNVKEEDVFMDHAGFDTYDSVYRAREIFQVDSMIVVTQKFHLSRAVYIARKLGIDAVGITADKQKYQNMQRNEIREILARAKAYIDILLKSKPKFLGETIDIQGDSKKSWD